MATDVERFEIKVNFDAAQVDRASEVFDLDPRAATDRRIWFGEVTGGRDGADALPLLSRGIILRVRVEDDGGDVTLKLRGPDGCVDVAGWARRTDGLDGAKVEGDWAARRLVSASLRADLGPARAAVLDTDRPSLTALLSPDQRTLAADLLVPVDAVTLLGPVAARRWKADDDLEAELWTKDDLRFLEISTVTKKDPEKALHRLEQRARDGGLTPDAGQDPKTTRVLRHLATRA